MGKERRRRTREGTRVSTRSGALSTPLLVLVGPCACVHDVHDVLVELLGNALLDDLVQNALDLDALTSAP